MTRRTTPAKKRAEVEHPVRARFKVPETGFGPTLDCMRAWLVDHLDHTACFLTSDSVPGSGDAVSLYCGDLALALAFQQTFALELATVDHS